MIKVYVSLQQPTYSTRTTISFLFQPFYFNEYICKVGILCIIIFVLSGLNRNLLTMEISMCKAFSRD